MSQQKLTYEGLYRTSRGIAVCVRHETNGVPRFETLFVHSEQVGRHEIDQLSSFIVRWYHDTGAPPWADDALPGIG